MSSGKDVIVIGGGLSGLVAAARLGRAGKRTLVLERASEVGGRAATLAHGPYFMNQGPHALYGKGAAKRELEALGVAIAGRAPTAETAYVGGRFERLPVGAMSLATSPILSMGARASAAWILARLGDPELARADETIAQWLDRNVRHADLRALLEALFRVSTYANAPGRASARAAFVQLRLAQSGGVLYLDHGWQPLVDGARRAAETGGAEIATCARAKSVEPSERGHRVTLDDGRSFEAPDVVLATSPAVVHALTGASFDLSPIHAACLDVALSALPRPDMPFALGIDRPLYASVHSCTARLAPEGGAVVHLAKYTDPDEPLDALRDEAELEALFDLLQPGWRAHVAHRRTLPRMVVANAIVTPAGRPDVGALGRSGLWICGDWVGPDGMLADAAVASAVRAAERVAQRPTQRTMTRTRDEDDRRHPQDPRIPLP